MKAQTLLWWRSQLRTGSYDKRLKESKRRTRKHRKQGRLPPAPEPRVDTGAFPKLTERVVDTLFPTQGMTASKLAEELEVPLALVQQELAELEAMGLIRRKGAGETLWFVP